MIKATPFFRILKPTKFFFAGFLLLLVVGVENVCGTTYYSRATGYWNTRSTWSLSSGGGQVKNGDYPTGADNVIIEGDFTVTTNADVTCSNINIASGSTLNVDGFNLAVSGTTTISGTLKHTSTTGTKIFSGLTTIDSNGTWINTINEDINFRGGLTNNGAFTAGNGIYTFSINNQALIGALSIPNTTVTGVTLINNGTLSVGTALIGTGGLTNTGTLNIGGTSVITTLTANVVGNTVDYTGATQTVKATTYYNISLSGAGTKTLGAATTVTGTLTLTDGILSTSTANILSITNTATSAITGGSTTSFINGPVKWTLPSNLASGSTYNFPVGSGSTFLPISLVNPTTGTGVVTAQIQASAGNSGGAVDGATLTFISSTEYWSLATSGNFSNSSISLARQTTISPLDAVAGCLTATGTYADFEGNVGTYGVSNSKAVGTNRFFVLAARKTHITTSVTNLTGFTYPVGFGPSSEQSFTVSGTNLSANILVTPPTNFEISTGSGASFVATSFITLPTSGGTVNTTTIYVRLKAGLSFGAVPAANIAVTTTGATTKNVTCSGIVATNPSITASTLSVFSYTYTAGPSAQQSFTVSGTDLIANVIIIPPTDWEISTTSGSGFASTPITLTQTGGTLASTTIYTRMKIALGVGSFSENIAISSTAASTINVACNGTVNSAPTIIASTSYLAGFIYTTGIGGPSSPQSFTVSGTNLTADITVTPPANFEVSNNGIAFYTTAITLTRSGSAVNATLYVRLTAGKAIGTYGPINVSMTSTGAVVKTVALCGSVVNTATILTSKATLTGFGYLFSAGGPSNNQNFIISGASLTADITVTPPVNYEISLTSGGSFQSTPITLLRTGTFVNDTIIYARLKSGLAAGNYTGENINISSGAITQNIPCIGTVFISPLITAGGGDLTCFGSTINLTSTGADIQNRYWLGPNNFYSLVQNPTLTNATTAMSGTYSATGNVVVGGNLVTNGDFESGNTSFGSSYIVSANLVPEGNYAVVADPYSVHTGFSHCSDHTIGGGTPTGKQMVVNGAPIAGAVIWSQSVPVIPNADYEFTYWVQSVVALAPSQLQLYVNGVSAGPVYTADLGTCAWKQFVYNTNAGSNTSINLELINQNTTANGNDFSLDDIVFQQILPATSTVSVTVNPILPINVAVSASANPVYKNTPVIFTATPTNGGTTSTYQWRLKSAGVTTNVGTNNDTYTNSGLATGDSIYCVLTSSEACTTSNPATSNKVGMTVNTRINYWKGSTDTDWGKATNWTANSVPLTGDDVEYATVSNYGSVATNDLQLDIDRTIGSLINATTRRLVIPASKELIVNNTITTDGNADRIYIYSSSSAANGSLIFHNAVNSPVYATVEMYSLASWNMSVADSIAKTRYKWQYFGIPLRSVLANPTFNGSYIRKWYETGSTIANHWISLSNESTLSPFYGYELCQQSAKIVYFKGILENGDFNSGTLAVTFGKTGIPNALYPGQHIFANPYTAAVNIKQLTFGTGTERTVYLYNTGTYGAWNTGSTQGNLAGKYLSIPINLAGITLPGQIPSMQAILIRTLDATAESPLATFGITYNSVIQKNTDQQRISKSDPASFSDKVYTMIDIKGSNSSDHMWIFSEPTCTRHFDNGWDGIKLSGGSALSPQLFAMEADGDYQVNSVNDMNNTDLGFQAGADSEYTLTFTQENIKTRYAGVYLVDLLENKTIDISESGTQYSFIAEPTISPIKRFKIVTRHYEKDAPDADTQVKIFSAKGSIFIQNTSNQIGKLLLFNMSGRCVKSIPFSANAVTTVSTNLIPGSYIAKGLTNSEEVTKRLIVQ